METMKLVFKNLEFNGIKLKRDFNTLPWNSQKQKSEILNALIEETSEYSKAKYKELEKFSDIDNIHITLSRSLISKIIYISSLTLGILALVLNRGNIETIYISFPIISMIGYYFMIFFNKRAEKRYIALNDGITDSFIELIFADARNEI